MSEQQPTVVQLMHRVMQDVTSIKKADKNTHFGFSFRGIDTVLTEVGPALRAHGVVVIPELLDERSEVVGKSVRVLVRVAYHFYGPAGDRLTALVPGEAMDAQDKASSKAMSVAFRTALLQALAIPTGERDPHAGAPVGKRLADLRARVRAEQGKRKWAWEDLAEDFTLWSKGAEIEAADEKTLTEYLRHLDPSSTTTMQRTRR